METNILTMVLLPLAIAIIMIGLGLSLTIDDFKRVVVYPKAVIIGLVCQMLILPVVCFFIAIGFNLSPELAVGLMLLSAAPGGACVRGRRPGLARRRDRNPQRNLRVATASRLRRR